MSYSSLTDILFSGGSAAETKQIGRLVKAGHIRKLLQGVYTSDLHGKDADIIRRHWRAIVAHTYPGALLSHRSAVEFQPSPVGYTISHYRSAQRCAAIFSQDDPRRSLRSRSYGTTSSEK